MRAGLLGGALCISVILFATIAAQDLTYRRRVNRDEGLRDLNREGGIGLRLVSFTGWREPVRLADAPVLKVGFFLTRPRKVFLTAVELRRHGSSHYQMQPVLKDWSAGWQEFAPWPTKDVLVPARIDPADVGVVARLDDNVEEGSGWVAPVLVYTSERPVRPPRYVLDFLPRNSLAKVDYMVANITTGAILVQRAKCDDRPGRAETCAQANVPFEIAFDMPPFSPRGSYRLVIDTRELNSIDGPSQEYFFHHESGT
jgi:hypothetical protein